MVPVVTDPTPLRAYRDAVGSPATERTEEAARRLAGLRVLHVNATPVGGGVAEILRSLVPLMNAVGVEASWFVLDPSEEFFAVTKKLHNALQGKPVAFSEVEMDLYWRQNERIAREIREQAGSPDVIVLHDAQVLPAACSLNGGTRLIWHCHVDLTAATEFVRSELLGPLGRRYDRCVVRMPEYAAAGLPLERTVAFAPAIDPFSPKNRPLPPEQASQLVARLGLDCRRPLVAQVSRFDPWKDPWGVIDAYRQARREVPGLQLALVGALLATGPRPVLVGGNIGRPLSAEAWRSWSRFGITPAGIETYTSFRTRRWPTI